MLGAIPRLMLHLTKRIWNPVRAGCRLASFFEVAQAGVDDFFDAAEFGAPQVAHVVEAAVYGVEAGVHVHRK